MALTSNLRQRAAALVLITGVEGVSGSILPHVPYNDAYYLVSALFNAGVLFCLTRNFAKTKFVGELVFLTLLQLTVQLIGWFLYNLYLPATAYNWSIHIIVILTILRIFYKGEYRGLFVRALHRIINIPIIRRGCARVPGLSRRV